MDFVILALPIPMIWNLHRAWQDRLALNGVFALGAFVCFASIYRIVVLFYISPTDPTYTVYQATLWTHVEPSIGLICSCLPIIRGLFPALKLKTRSNNTGPYYINTSVSNSNSNFLSKSSPCPPDLENLKMERMYGAQIETGQNRFLGDESNINVRTDIAITGHDSTSSSLHN